MSGHDDMNPGSFPPMSSTTSESQVLDNVPKQLFIGGEWRDAAGSATLSVEDPSTEESLCEVADASEEDARAALDAAVEAQGAFRDMGPRERSDILRRAFRTDMGRTGGAPPV